MIAKDENKNLVLGIIAVAFIFKYIPRALNIITELYASDIAAAKMVDRFYLDQLAGPTGLLLLGWYLVKYPLKKPVRIFLYILGIIAEITSVLLTQIFMDKIPNIRSYTYDYVSIFVVIVAIALFAFLKNILGEKIRESTYNVQQAWYGNICFTRYVYRFVLSGYPAL